MSTSNLRILGFVSIIPILLYLLSNVDININHNVSTPHIPSSHNITCHNKILYENCDVILSQEISSPNSYTKLFEKLLSSSSLDTYRIHLIGYGGDFLTVRAFEAVIKQSKAEIIMVVDGPVFSAHAFLATMGNKLIINKNDFMMFHDIQYPPTSAGTPATIEFKKISATIVDQIVQQGILSSYEASAILINNANEVYIHGFDLLKRFKNLDVNGSQITINLR